MVGSLMALTLMAEDPFHLMDVYQMAHRLTGDLMAGIQTTKVQLVPMASILMEPIRTVRDLLELMVDFPTAPIPTAEAKLRHKVVYLMALQVKSLNIRFMAVTPLDLMASRTHRLTNDHLRIVTVQLESKF